MHALFEVTDPLGRKIICPDTQWFSHILVDHPYLDGRLDEVKEVVEGPNFIADDSHFQDRDVYYRFRSSGATYLKVVVRFTSEDEGEILTAFPTDKGKQKEVIKWTRSSN